MKISDNALKVGKYVQGRLVMKSEILSVFKDVGEDGYNELFEANMITGSVVDDDVQFSTNVNFLNYVDGLRFPRGG